MLCTHKSNKTQQQGCIKGLSLNISAVVLSIFLLSACGGSSSTDTNTTTMTGTESGTDSESVSCISGSNHELSIPVSGRTEKLLSQNIDGEQVIRRYLIHAPENFDTNKCYPLHFVLHGAGGNPDGSVNTYKDQVNAGEFIGIYPAGYLGFWNLGKEQSTADDVAFIESVADDLKQYSNLDHKKRYVTGFSNGAGMAHTLAGKSDYFRALATVITSLTTTNQPTDKNRQPPILQILGENDNAVPYQGGTGIAGHVFLSGDESALTWAKHNDCNLTPVNTTLSDNSIHTSYSECANNGEVINYKVAGAGHGIPANFAGGLHQLIWEFLKKH